MKRIVVALVLLGAGFGGGWYLARRPAGTERKALYYVDPMHPWYKSDRPGIAPDCNMPLVAVYEGDAEPGTPAKPDANRKVLYYFDPQAPAYRNQNPGFNPETGNELVPKYADDPATFSPGTIQVSAEKQQLIGVTYAEAELTEGAQTIRAAGKIAIDERRVHHVHTRTEGWIEHVAADFVGQAVKKGQLLFTLYSPELYASQQEYLLALRARERMRRPEDRERMESLVRASKQRLDQWEMTPEQVAALDRGGEAVRALPYHAPASGIITMRNAFPHQMAKPDMELYTIVDYARVWVLADVYEYEAAGIRPGMTARVGATRIPAQVTFVQPEVDPTTRTVKVRLEMANPEMTLKPEMFVDVEFRVVQPRRLTVPASAVLDSGLAKRVFLDRGNGYFEPRTVETGERYDDRVVVRKGLQAGDRVVAGGNFLIDSESQLKAATSGMGAPRP